MKIMITGGSCSGKSIAGEHITCRLAEKECYYFATMRVFSEEDGLRVARHRKQREGKGYQTIEAPVDILKYMPHRPDAAVLVDCVGNLWANENYENKKSPEALARELSMLYEYYKHTVFVTNDVFLSGESYTKETEAYMQGLGIINHSLAEQADITIEMCCGIPIIIKGEKQYHEIFKPILDCDVHVHKDSSTGGGLE